MSKRRPRRSGATAIREPSTGRLFEWREVLWAAAIVLVTLLAYRHAFQGGFIWDDDAYVTDNETLRSPEGLRRIWLEVGATPQYYPLVFTTFWVEWHLFGADPFPFHLVNVLLHAASALLVARIGRRLGIPGSLAAAFVFALHPVHVESVAWITERKNVLSGFFYLASMAAFLRASPPSEQARFSVARPWYVLSLILFAAALLSKTVTATLPVALLLLSTWKSGRVMWRTVALVAPMFVAGAAAGSLTAWVEAHHVGTARLAVDLSFLDRCLIASHAVWFYLGKLLLPVRLTFIYPRWHLDPGALVSFLAPLSALVMSIVLWILRKRWGLGPLVAWLYFVVTLFPALGFIDVFPMRFSFVADHFQYLASLGPIVLICAAMTKLLERRAAAALAVAVALVLGAVTSSQALIYRNLETLWRDTLAKNPRASIAHINLGNLLQEQRRYLEADRSYREALEDPECLDRADVLRNLGLNAAARGDAAAAMSYYERALVERPGFTTVLVNLGELQRAAGNPADAMASFERAVASDPDDPVARNNLGSARFDANRFDEAATEFRVAIGLRPGFPEAHYNLGNALAAMKQPKDAETEYVAALRLRSDYADAHVNLARLQLEAGRVEESESHFEAALRADPGHALAHYGLALALTRQGRSADAAPHYQEAHRLRPDLAIPPGFEGR